MNLAGKDVNVKDGPPSGKLPILDVGVLCGLFVRGFESMRRMAPLFANDLKRMGEQRGEPN